MNNPNNLFNMMQTGGLTSTTGGTALARALQRQSDIKKLERQQRAEARRQKRGSLFGSIGSLAGGLLGAALTPFTGGLSLALASGLGAGLGRRAGEGLGAGKSKRYDRSGTVFGQQAFRDVEQASRDYTRGMGERALTSGLQTALSAYLNPTGMYGKVAGKLRPSSSLLPSQIALPTASEAALQAGRQMGSEGAGLVFGRGGMDALYSGQGGFNLTKPPSLLDYTTGNSIYSGGISSFNPFQNFEDGGFLKLRRGAYIPGDDEDGFGEGFGGSGSGSDGGFSGNVEDDNIPDTNIPDTSGTSGTTGVGSTSDTNNTSVSLPNFGSFTASGILGEAGLDPSSDQLALFQQFDPTKVQQAKTGAEQSLLSMTGGMGLSSLGGGFGSRQRASTSAIGRGEDLIGDTIEQEQRAYESQVLGTAADLIAGGAEFDKKGTSTQDDPIYGQFDRPPLEDPNWNPPENATNGMPYDFNGVRYIFDPPNWVTEEQYESDLEDYYDPYG